MSGGSISLVSQLPVSSSCLLTTVQLPVLWQSCMSACAAGRKAIAEIPSEQRRQLLDVVSAKYAAHCPDTHHKYPR